MIVVWRECRCASFQMPSWRYCRMIKLVDICRTYHLKNQDVKALDGISLEIPDCSFTAITGHSGCGKTTLLNIIAGYDRPDSGLYLYDSRLVNDYDDQQKTDFYRHEVSMIFQEFHLLPYLNVYENIRLPLHYQKRRMNDKEMDAVLERVGLRGYGRFYPHQLSGGQKQRVALARTLVSEVRVVLADEPTGALDRENADNIVKLLKGMKEYGMTVILVTHDEGIAMMADRIITLENGHVVS
ncbi:MAG: ABC transporter ATP-binding protein [Erysipelotrichaceae bacterium]|nr:ABC transporter ATP-binding protein [Erysipelotrichaceae bacterium]